MMDETSYLEAGHYLQEIVTMNSLQERHEYQKQKYPTISQQMMKLEITHLEAKLLYLPEL